MTDPKTASEALMFCIDAEVKLRDYYLELAEHAEEIVAKVNRDTEMPDELKKLLGQA